MAFNRELSQFASVITVNDETQNVGIGTTNPVSKLSVGGDLTASGNITATAFVGDGSGLTNLPGGGGGASVSIGTEAPANPLSGDLWYSSVYGRTFIYYNDENSSQWVDAAPFNIGNIGTASTATTLIIGRRTTAATISLVGTGMTIRLRDGVGTVNF